MKDIDITKADQAIIRKHLNLFDVIKTKKKISKLFKEQKELFTKQYDQNLNKEQLINISNQQMKSFCQASIIKTKHILHKPLKILCAIEQLGYLGIQQYTISIYNIFQDQSLSTLVCNNFLLFGGSILQLSGSEHFSQIIDQLDRGIITGSYCLTELGSRSHVSTKVVQSKQKNLILQSTTNQSQKIWVMNGAQCDYGLVFANLIINKRNEGIHAFLVRFREEGEKMMKIEMDTHGSTFGLHGLDFSRIIFNNLEIPNASLLDRYCSIENGKYECQLTNKERYEQTFQALIFTRLGSLSVILAQCKKSIYIGFKYASQRLVMGQNGLSNAPISSFGLFQQSMFPQLAKTVCINLAFNELKHLYSNYSLRRENIYGGQLYLWILVFKCLTSEHCRELSQQMTERIGGQGYLWKNNICELISFAHWSIVGLGDNVLLMQKIAKALIIGIALRKFEHPSFNTNKQFIPQIQHFNSSETLMDLIKLREIELENRLNYKGKKIAKLTGKNIEYIYSIDQSKLTQNLAQTYGIRIIAELCFVNMQRLPILEKAYFNHYFKLFLMEFILDHVDYYLVKKMLNINAAREMQKDRQFYIEQIGKIQESTIDNFGIPEEFIQSKIHDNYQDQYKNFRPQL